MESEQQVINSNADIDTSNTPGTGKQGSVIIEIKEIDKAVEINLLATFKERPNEKVAYMTMIIKDRIEDLLGNLFKERATLVDPQEQPELFNTDEEVATATPSKVEQYNGE